MMDVDVDVQTMSSDSDLVLSSSVVGLQCPECPDIFFESLPLLCDHLNSGAHGCNRCAWVCNYCSAIFTEANVYAEHLVAAHRIQREVLESTDIKHNPLLGPTLISPDEELLECPECGLAFSDTNSIRLHRVRRHNITNLQVVPIPCPICNLVIQPDPTGVVSYRQVLTRHANKEHDIRGILCAYCGKILSKPCTLNRHIEQVHLNLQIHKPAECEVCGKVFSKKGHLDRHMRSIHLGMRQSSEPCPICGKVFATRASLVPHIELVHRGVRQKCPICGKVLSDLLKHMRSAHGKYKRRDKFGKYSSVSGLDGARQSRSESVDDLAKTDDDECEDDDDEDVKSGEGVLDEGAHIVINDEEGLYGGIDDGGAIEGATSLANSVADDICISPRTVCISPSDLPMSPPWSVNNDEAVHGAHRSSPPSGVTPVKISTSNSSITPPPLLIDSALLVGDDISVENSHKYVANPRQQRQQEQQSLASLVMNQESSGSLSTLQLIVYLQSLPPHHRAAIYAAKCGQKDIPRSQTGVHNRIKMQRLASKQRLIAATAASLQGTDGQTSSRGGVIVDNEVLATSAALQKTERPSLEIFRIIES